MARGEQSCIIQGDLNADKTYVGLAAVGEVAIYHGKEDRGIGDHSCVDDFEASRIVEG